MLLSAEHLSKNYGMKQLLCDVSLYLNENERIGIIGVNGTGKSTLLKILSNVESADSGKVCLDPNVQVSYLPQNPHMDENRTVLEQVFAGFPLEFRAMSEHEAKTMLTKLGIMDFEQTIGTLSGGQRKRVALASALIHPSDVLILDEPTNHLDSDMVAWLEQFLLRFRGGLVMVTHDRYFLERVVTKICELSQAGLYTYDANYSKYLELKSQRLEMQEASERKRQSILRREYQWIMRGARARSTKSRERIARYEDLKEQAAPVDDSSAVISAASSRLGKKTIELSHVSKAYDGRTVISDFSYQVLRRDRVGIVGKNGAGKSTLLNLIATSLSPDSGTVDIGATVCIGYFTQEGRELDESLRVYDFITDIASEVQTSEGIFSATQMLERFLFTADLQYSVIGRLSGGERRRLYLLSILMTAPNILLLDEPTNDLDIETLTILEDYLDCFPGAVFAVSHDRYFLDKIAEHVFEVCENGAVKQYNGNFSDYLDAREETREPVLKKAPTSKAAPDAKPQKPRFSYKEQREFETIDDEIAAVEQQIAACDNEIKQCSSDYVRLQELMEKKSAFQATLDAKTERWIYLNELAERIEASST